MLKTERRIRHKAKYQDEHKNENYDDHTHAHGATKICSSSLVLLGHRKQSPRAPRTGCNHVPRVRYDLQHGHDMLTMPSGTDHSLLT
jgi:hypothetical protein